jgi:hypothetical protein
MAHEGTVGRKEKADSFSRERWVDNSAKLLDHYCACLASSYSPGFVLLMGVSVLLTEERMIKDPIRGIETKRYYVNSRVRHVPLSISLH